MGQIVHRNCALCISNTDADLHAFSCVGLHVVPSGGAPLRRHHRVARPGNCGRFWTCVLVLGLSLASLSSSLFAEEPAYHFTNWQTQDGLPSNKIMAVLQTRDGYIWIGTYEGLVRFDGVSFALYDANAVDVLHDSSVTSLFESSNGTLWVGHSSGRITSLKGGVFTGYPARANWKASRVQAIGEDAAGDIWAWDDAGQLARIADGKLLTPSEGRSAGIRGMTCSEDGEMWITSRGTLSNFKEGVLSVVPLLEEMDGYVHGVCAARGGGVWVVAQGGLWKWSGDAWSRKFGQLSTGYSPLNPFIEMNDGRLIAGTSDHGVIVIEPEVFNVRQLSRSSGFASDWVVSLAEDQEGGLWIGSGGAGLFRSREEVVTTLVAPDAWQGRSVLSVAPTSTGGLWVSTEGAGLYQLEGQTWTHHARETGINNPYIWSVQETSDATVWFGTWSAGLYKGSNGTFSQAPGIDPIMTPMTAIIPARAGGLWVGSYTGVLRYNAGVSTWVEPANERQLRHVRALVEHSDGSLWVGSIGDGLGLIKDGNVRRFTKADGLVSNYVQTLFMDQAGTLWIGTRGRGLARFKNGKFSTIDVAQGLSNGVICHITEDTQGFVWLSSHGGIMRISKAELEACADGQLSRVNCLTYGLSDGLLTLVCPGGVQPAGCTTPDGRLVFATDRGVAMIDPVSLKTNPLPPPMVIEAVVAGERVLREGSLAGQRVTVDAGTKRIEIKYTGLSFAAADKVRFRHRLDGLDAQWNEVGRERLAVYNYVPPGDYRFSVMACNNDNVWSVIPASMTLVVLPHFWQTLWFKLLVVGLLLSTTAAGVWMQTRARFKRVLERAERERAIEVERSRIANDMHDDLGSNLTRITMLSETAKSDSDLTRTREVLGQIYDTARGVTRAMDEIVWAVNPKHDTLESLVYYFEKFALDLLGAAGIRARLEMPAEFPLWSPRSEVRHNLFLAFKEALNNAVRHSGATTVTISMLMDEKSCTLTIQDDGRGIVPASSSERDRFAGGNGTANIRERMDRIGGVAEIRSEPGDGTVVFLSAPRDSSEKISSAPRPVNHRNL